MLCGAQGAVLLLLRAAACELELREKDAGVCAAANAAELRYPCAPPLLLHQVALERERPDY